MSITCSRRFRVLSASLAALTTFTAVAACSGENTGGADATTTTTTPQHPRSPPRPLAISCGGRSTTSPRRSGAVLEDVKDHVSADFLRYMVPADGLVDVFRDTVDERGGVRFERFAQHVVAASRSDRVVLVAATSTPTAARLASTIVKIGRGSTPTPRRGRQG